MLPDSCSQSFPSYQLTSTSKGHVRSMWFRLDTQTRLSPMLPEKYLNRQPPTLYSAKPHISNTKRNYWFVSKVLESFYILFTDCVLLYSLAIFSMRFTNIVCGLGGFLIGTLACTSFIAMMNPPVCVPDTGLHGYQSSEEYYRLYNSKGVCNKYQFEHPLRHPDRYSEEYYCLYVIFQELVFAMEYRNCFG